MNFMFRIVALLCALQLAATPSFAASTIDTTVPVQGAAFASAPIRSNFTKAASDINALQARSAQPTQPSGLSNFQDWANTAGCPTNCSLTMFDGTVPVPWGALNQSTHSFSAAVGASSIIPNAPLTATFSGGTATLGLNAGTGLSIGGGNLNLAPITSGHVLANATGGSAAPADTPASSWFDQAYCSTVGYIIARTIGAWTCSKALPVRASYFGAACNGSGDDSTAIMAAVAAAGDAPVLLDRVGICPVYSNIFRNTWAAPGILTVPGLKLRGLGKGITILDTHVANDYAISVNPAWQAAHKALAGITTSSGGSLSNTTYYVQVTVNDPLGNEIIVTTAKSIAVGASGRITITLPPINSGYSYTIYIGTTSTPGNYATVSGADAVGLGGGQTVPITAVGSSHALPSGKQAVWQNAEISDLSITNSTATANASGVLFFKVGYAGLKNVYMQGLTGDGFGVPDYTGDVDGSFFVNVDESKFDTIAGFCVNAAGAALELSALSITNTAFNLCGTPPANLNVPVTVSAISNASSGVVTTSTAHNLLAGDQIAPSVSGMTLSSTWYRVCGTVTSNAFNLCDLNGNAVNTTSLGSFTSGTVSLSWRPAQWNPTTLTTNGSGGIAWLGLIATIRSGGCTQCNNVFMYASENGMSDNLTVEGVDVENTNGKGFYIAGLSGGTLKNSEFLATSGVGNTIGGVQLGTGFAGGGVQNFLIDVMKVRSNVAPSTMFEQFQNTNIGATFQDTNRVRNVTWQAFDAANQTRFSGFIFDPIPGQVQFSISAPNTAQLIPIGQGGSLPIHPKVGGEWVTYHVPAVGVTGSVTGGLTPTTQYNCFTHPANATSAPYALSFACNSHATAVLGGEGYTIDSTDATWTFIGTATTDGSGNFQTSGVQTSWYPPGGGGNVAPGSAGKLAKYTGTSNVGPLSSVNNGVVSTDGSGNAVISTTLPNGLAMQTPASLTLTNATGLPISTGLIGAGTGVLAALANAVNASNGLATSASPTFSGTFAGTYTLGGTPSIAGSAINSGTVSGSFMSAVNLAAGNVNGGVVNTLPNANLAGSGALTIGSTSIALGAASTVLAGLTSVTDPLLIGGTGTGSSLTLQSTSGIGVTDFVRAVVGNNGAIEGWRVLSNGFMGINNTNPQNALVVGGAGGVNAGLEIAVGTAISFASYNRNTSAYAVAHFDAASVDFRPNASAAFGATSAGITFGSGGTLLLATTAPTISSGFCSTSPAISASNGSAVFDINVGTSCSGSTGTLGMPAATTGWVCDFANVTNPAANTVYQTGGATNTVTLTNYVRTTGVAGNFTASDHIRAKCAAY
jgi:hypothetical protein